MTWLRKSDAEGIYSQLWQFLEAYSKYFVESQLKSFFFKDVFEHKIFQSKVQVEKCNWGTLTQIKVL